MSVLAEDSASALLKGTENIQFFELVWFGTLEQTEDAAKEISDNEQSDKQSEDNEKSDIDVQKVTLLINFLSNFSTVI